jgi:hypothetical protein
VCPPRESLEQVNTCQRGANDQQYEKNRGGRPSEPVEQTAKGVQQPNAEQDSKGMKFANSRITKRPAEATPSIG